MNSPFSCMNQVMVTSQLEHYPLKIKIGVRNISKQMEMPHIFFYLPLSLSTLSKEIYSRPFVISHFANYIIHGILCKNE